MKISKNRGFTLLELLIVLVIVGVLTTIVLLATSSARKKGGDAGVKSNLHTVRNQASLFFTNNNTYGTTWDDTCPTTYQISGGTMFYTDKVIVEAINKAVSSGGIPAGGADYSWCYNNSSVWAAAVTLKSNPAYSWCVDASGKSRQVNAIPFSAINATTHLCN